MLNLVLHSFMIYRVDLHESHFTVFIIYCLKQAVLHLQQCQPTFKSISFPDWLNWAVCLRWPYYALKKTVKDLEESEALTPQWYIVFIVYLTMSYTHNE